MKIVTWNTDCKTGPEIYDYVFSAIHPDLALLQEVDRGILSAANIRDYTLYWREIGGKRPWGSAIAVSNSFRSESLAIAFDEGWIVGAKIITPSKTTLNVVSLHARLKDENERVQYVIPHLRRVFEVISPFMSDGQNIVIGGDFNADRLIDEHSYQPGHTKHNPFFDYLEKDLRLVSVVKGQTFFGHRSKQPYQDDYIFINSGLERRLRAGTIPERDTVKKLSDHSPLIASLEL